MVLENIPTLLVKLDNCSDRLSNIIYPGLEIFGDIMKGVVPIRPGHASFKVEVENDYLGLKHVNVNRKQLPVVSAYGMTDYKAQSGTLPLVCLDLSPCFIGASAYVMLSRIINSDGLYIARPYDRSVLEIPISEDLKKTIETLQRISDATVDNLKENYSEWIVNNG